MTLILSFFSMVAGLHLVAYIAAANVPPKDETHGYRVDLSSKY